MSAPPRPDVMAAMVSIIGNLWGRRGPAVDGGGMKNFFKKTRYLLVSREDGVAAVEMVILFPVLVLLVVGLVEFGHLWYVRQTLTNASREGARAAVIYPPAAHLPTRAAWATTEAQTAVSNYLENYSEITNLTCPPAHVVFPNGTNAGDPVIVTVTSPSGLILLNKLLPAFGGITLAAETTMSLQ